MAELFFPFDAGPGANLNELNWRELAMALNSIGAGVVPNQDDKLECYADSTGMNVKVKTGRAGCFGHYYRNTAEITRTVGANASGSIRVDTVVVEFNFGSNVATAKVVPGSTVPAALTQDIATVWQSVIGYVVVPAGAGTIRAQDAYACLDRYGAGVVTSLPIGSIVECALMFPIIPSQMPAGFVACDGAGYSKYLLPKLCGLQGAQLVPDFGATIMFGLDVNGIMWTPDHRERVAVGAQTMGTIVGGSQRGVGAGLGRVGGSATHTLTAAEMPAHTHVIIGKSNSGMGSQVRFTHDNATGINDDSSTQNAGGGDAHNNLQPYAAVTKMMKVL